MKRALRAAIARRRWKAKQKAAGPGGRFYGDGGTIHDTGHLDVEVHDGRVVAVWFRCQMLPFVQADVDAERARSVRPVTAAAVRLTGVELATTDGTAR